MKLQSMIAMASAVALASTIYAHPSLFKRFTEATTALTCIPEIVAMMGVPSNCQSVLSTDNKLVEAIAQTGLTFNLEDASPKIFAGKVIIKVVDIPGLLFLPAGRLLANLSILDGTGETSSFVTAWTQVDVQPGSSNLELSLTSTALTVTPVQTPAFISLITTLTTSAAHNITLRGAVNVQFIISLPKPPVPFFGDLVAAVPLSKTIPVNGVVVSSDVVLSGFNNFGGVAQGQLASVSAIETGTGDSGLVRFKINLNNPGTISIEFGAVSLQVWVPGSTTEVLGIATIAKLGLVPGNNDVDVVLEAKSAVQLGEFFPAKTGLTLAFSGFEGSSTNTLAKGAISAIKFNVMF